MKLKSLFITSLLILTSCASSQKELSFKPIEKNYKSTYEKVWRAAQLSLANYPIQINNIDTGLLETQYLSGDEKWTPPFPVDKSYGGSKYKIQLKVIKGRLIKRKKSKKRAIKISITKLIFKRKDYFSKYEKVPSDGLEEESILYRIKRELLIDKALERASRKSNEL